MSIKENNIENDLIEKLKELKYTYRLDIKNREDLKLNLRKKFQALNIVNLTDNEFKRVLEQIITPDVFKTAKLLREINSFERDDGTQLHYMLVNIKNWCKNSFEVINQLRINTKDSFHRYDVILLINGLPLVQIELKTLQISPRQAIRQIIEYKKDEGNGYTNTLLSFLQLFIVSNRTNTYYFANNNIEHFNFDADERFLPIYQYANRENKKIIELNDFSDAFLNKCKLAEMINKYMVLIENQSKLMIMRAYQIYAVESIIECIDKNLGNGYIWHTTGSGKTLTSFKASTLLKANEKIKKILFVVDRKDLDRQTREEFNKFQENCVEENTNTKNLVERLLSRDYANKVIVTTIQKLALALDSTNKNNYKKELQPLSREPVVFIFDECHRSQFGKNHKAIKEFFPKSQLFGFTGTPIFKKNAKSMMIEEDDKASFKTTEDIFKKELHSYTIIHAIEDKNVLRFHIDYFKPNNQEGKFSTKAVTKAIIEKHDKATANKKFNALLATSSINDAIKFHKYFKELDHDLNIACIFSPPAEKDKDIAQLQEDLETEKEDNKKEPEKKKEALKQIIKDYNKLFNTNHLISKFDAYYQDVQTRIKDQKYSNQELAHDKKLDIVIVVDMLLTGFDSKFLNTLYVDKKLKYHGLIQAFSRTNRVLNDTKPYGNILDFRSQEKAVDEAITLFSDKLIEKPKKIWIVESASKTIKTYEKENKRLVNFMTSQGLQNEPKELANLKGDNAKAEFLNIFKEVQRLKTQLNQHTNLTKEQLATIEEIMPDDKLRAFKGMYIDIAKELQSKGEKGEKVSDTVKELDFEYVLFASALVDYDYIMALIAKYSNQDPKKHKMSKEKLISYLKSDTKLINEYEDMIAYINTLEIGKVLKEDDIKKEYENFKDNKNIIKLEELAKTHKLKSGKLKEFVNRVLDRYIFDGEQLTDLLEPLGLKWRNRVDKELELMKDLSPLLKKMAKGKEISGLKLYDE